MESLRRFSVIAFLFCALFLFSACAGEKDPAPSSPPSTEETSAPIYSNNVPMDYLIMANRSDSLMQNHQSISIHVENVLYEETETWFDGSRWFRAGKGEERFLTSDDLHWAVVKSGDDTTVQYSIEEMDDAIFLPDAYQLVESNSDEEIIVEEAEYGGAFHVITERPIGEELEFYSMLNASENDKIREEYVLDSATLSLLINETALLRADGSEEKIGTMTVTYDQEIPDNALNLEKLLHETRNPSSPSKVTIVTSDGNIAFSVAKDTLLEVLPAEGTKLFRDKKKKDVYHGPSIVSEDFTLYLY